MIQQKLPGIKDLGYLPTDNLQRQIMQKYLAGVPVGILTDVTPINFVGTPTCESVSDYDNGGRIEKTTLKFLTNDDIPTYKDIAFVITDCDSKSFIIGTREKPRPIIHVSRFSGQADGEPSAFSFEVTLYAQRSLIPCSI